MAMPEAVGAAIRRLMLDEKVLAALAGAEPPSEPPSLSG
jgi:hypothetical protein